MRLLLGNRQAVGAGALALGGLAYGLFETLTKPSEAVVPGGLPPRGLVTPPPLPPPVPPASGSSASTTTVAGPVGSPLPAPPASGAAVAGVGQAAPRAAALPIGSTAAETVPPSVLRVIRLSLSAAQADGELTRSEADVILAQARAVGAEALIARDLAALPAIESIVEGVQDARQREELYSVAFAIVRADEQVTGVERAYLKRVAAALQLGDAVVARLELDTISRMSAT